MGHDHESKLGIQSPAGGQDAEAGDGERHQLRSVDLVRREWPDAAGGARVPPWVATSIALLRDQEAGGDVTDEAVLAECESVGIDPTPVMILVRQKAPAAILGTFTTADGRRWMDGVRLIDLWFSLAGRMRVAIDTREGRAALKALMEITGMSAPWVYEFNPKRETAHSSEIDAPEVSMPRTEPARASRKRRARGRRATG